MMKKMNIIGCLFYGIFLLSCNSWLDLKPYGEVEADKMFEDEQGFIQTLTGSYVLLTDPTAYGYELTAGFPDEIVHYWKERSEFYHFDYENMDVESRLDATWSQMYKAIANTNLVLDYLEGKTPDDLEYYNLIRGEALGLRAYLHLDLLRLYGPVLKETGTDVRSIPYHETFSNQIVQMMPAGEVLSRIQRDLDSAYVLLKDDPIKVYGRDETKEEFAEVEAPEVKGLAFSFRGCRMNYYAVCATLARLYLLKDDYTNALKYASEVIDDGKDIFEFVRREDVSSSEKRDRMFERELIWALYDSKTDEHLSKTVGNADHALDNLFQDYVYQDGRGYGSEEDYRTNYWFANTNATPNYWYLCKYERKFAPGGETDKTPWKTVVPLIRLSEMYFIAAEANLATNPAEAYRLLNQVRAARNLPALPTSLEHDGGALRDQLVYECQKEYWGEGKLFYFNKRLFLNIQTREENIPATRAIYELPVPVDEIEFGDNNNKMK